MRIKIHKMVRGTTQWLLSHFRDLAELSEEKSKLINEPFKSYWRPNPVSMTHSPVVLIAHDDCGFLGLHGRG